jgi:hypothetical protein
VSDAIPEITFSNSLPDWLSPEISEHLSIVALVVLGILLLLVLRFISKIILKLAFMLIILALALGIWSERSDLSGCINTCDCEIFGQKLQIPSGKNPFCDES